MDLLVKAKFRFPEFSGIASDWSVIVNSSHLENIRTWMRLIEINPPVMKKLAASLIVNLKLGGVFLKDTDVFQRDISRLLNSDYRDVFYLITSLAAVFPAFYHDIGATGDIRAFTEKIDTNHQMNDLIHFLRKQVHVESSSRTVLLIQRIMEFWMSGEKQLLQNLVPAEVYENLDRVFRLINLDSEDIASIVYAEVKKRFPEHTENHFWDFLNAVGKTGFLQCLESVSFEGISAEELKDTVNCFTEYFDTQYPAEMTKILHHIRNMFEIDISKTQIWKFLYEISDEEFRKIFENVRFLDVSRVNIEKFITFLHVYRMIFDKYNFSEVRDIEKLELYARENLFDPQPGLFEKLKGKDLFPALEAVLRAPGHAEVGHTAFEQGVRARGHHRVQAAHRLRDPVDVRLLQGEEVRHPEGLFPLNLIRERLFEKLIEASSVYPHERLDYGEIKKILNLFYQDLRHRRAGEPRDAVAHEPPGRPEPEDLAAQGHRHHAAHHSRRDIGPLQRNLQVRVQEIHREHRHRAHKRTVPAARIPAQRRDCHRPLRAQPDHAVAAPAALRQPPHTPEGPPRRADEGPRRRRMPERVRHAQGERRAHFPDRAPGRAETGARSFLSRCGSPGRRPRAWSSRRTSRV